MFRILKVALAVACGIVFRLCGSRRTPSSSSPAQISSPARSNGSDPLVGLRAARGDARPNIARTCCGTLRAGLNVAALQCQFSPFLRTVSNYNSFLAQHSDELADAYTSAERLFRPAAAAPPTGRRSSTIIRPSPTTISRPACAIRLLPGGGRDRARTALLAPEGPAATTSRAGGCASLRNSLVPTTDNDQAATTPIAIPLPAMPAARPIKCFDKKNNLKPNCPAGVASR